MLSRQVESKFLASQAYGLDKSRFHFFDSAFDLVLGLASNLLGWMPWLWDVSAGLVTKAGFAGWGGDIPTSLCFVVLTMIAQVRGVLFASPVRMKVVCLTVQSAPSMESAFAFCRPARELTAIRSLAMLKFESVADLPCILPFAYPPRVTQRSVQTVVGLPFALYSTFIVEAKHGFNKQTIGLFFADKVGL